jgi:hypothetical protein
MLLQMAQKLLDLLGVPDSIRIILLFAWQNILVSEFCGDVHCMD